MKRGKRSISLEERGSTQQADARLGDGDRPQTEQVNVGVVLRVALRRDLELLRRGREKREDHQHLSHTERADLRTSCLPKTLRRRERSTSFLAAGFGFSASLSSLLSPFFRRFFGGFLGAGGRAEPSPNSVTKAGWLMIRRKRFGCRANEALEGWSSPGHWQVSTSSRPFKGGHRPDVGELVLLRIPESESGNRPVAGHDREVVVREDPLATAPRDAHRLGATPERQLSAPSRQKRRGGSAHQIALVRRLVGAEADVACSRDCVSVTSGSRVKDDSRRTVDA